MRAAREAAGLSQLALANRLGVARETVSRWESGRPFQRSRDLHRLADELDVTVADLTGHVTGRPMVVES